MEGELTSYGLLDGEQPDGLFSDRLRDMAQAMVNGITLTPARESAVIFQLHHLTDLDRPSYQAGYFLQLLQKKVEC